jgi:hypothetical protein
MWCGGVKRCLFCVVLLACYVARDRLETTPATQQNIETTMPSSRSCYLPCCNETCNTLVHIARLNCDACGVQQTRQPRNKRKLTFEADDSFNPSMPLSSGRVRQPGSSRNSSMRTTQSELGRCRHEGAQVPADQEVLAPGSDHRGPLAPDLSLLISTTASIAAPAEAHDVSNLNEP